MQFSPQAANVGSLQTLDPLGVLLPIVGSTWSWLGSFFGPWFQRIFVIFTYGFHGFVRNGGIAVGIVSLARDRRDGLSAVLLLERQGSLSFVFPVDWREELRWFQLLEIIEQP